MGSAEVHQDNRESDPTRRIGYYSADITAGSLKLPESRVIADLLLRQVSDQEWRNAIVEQNLLRASRPSTAIRVARLVRHRLEPMGEDLWRLVRDGTGSVAVHGVLAAAMASSSLLLDFFDLVVGDQYRAFATTLPKRLWDEFLQGCRSRDASVESWSTSTARKCGTVVYHILAQAGYIDNCRSLKLQSVHVSSDVVNYLETHGHHRVLRCMQVAK